MMILLIVCMLLGFAIVHIIKLFRLYLIIMDKKVSFERFVPAYLRTTLVNLIVPFKLGEIYRVCEFARMTKSFEAGFFGVLIDRFFDTLAIVILLLPYQICISGNVTAPVVLLTLFIIAIVFTYMIFPSSYSFLNSYIIRTKSSKRSMSALKGLEILHEWYENVKELVIGRYGLLIMSSVAAWVVELMVLAGFSHIYGRDFKLIDFGQYIESIILGNSYGIGRMYTSASICVIAVATVIGSIIYIVNKIRRQAS